MPLTRFRHLPCLTHLVEPENNWTNPMNMRWSLMFFFFFFWKCVSRFKLQPNGTQWNVYCYWKQQVRIQLNITEYIYIYVHWHQFSFRIGLPNRTHIVCKISWLDFLYAKGKAFKCEKWCNKPIGITFNWKNKWRWFRHFRCCAMFWCRNNDAQNGVLDTLQIEWTEETRKKNRFQNAHKEENQFQAFVQSIVHRFFLKRFFVSLVCPFDSIFWTNSESHIE